jgi:hypothetical protein
MKELLDKIGSYNLFNYLLPGSLYLGYLQVSLPYDFSDDNLVIVGFFGYFLGLIISRVGSIFIEPVLKSIGFIKFREYAEFIEASRKDEKLEVLSEQNNTYRSTLALVVVVGLSQVFKFLVAKFELSNTFVFITIFILLLLLFLGAYRKQTGYITKRIDKTK